MLLAESEVTTSSMDELGGPAADLPPFFAPAFGAAFWVFGKLASSSANSLSRSAFFRAASAAFSALASAEDLPLAPFSHSAASAASAFAAASAAFLSAFSCFFARPAAALELAVRKQSRNVSMTIAWSACRSRLFPYFSEACLRTIGLPADTLMVVDSREDSYGCCEDVAMSGEVKCEWLKAGRCTSSFAKGRERDGVERLTTSFFAVTPVPPSRSLR